MKLTETAYDVGVIIGRFQVPDLHDAHRALIQFVCDKHDKVLILLGLSPLKATIENPLDFEARKQMILEAFPRVSILYVKDVHDDVLWSRKVDEQVGDFLTSTQTAVLYGSRDSFIKHYTGRFQTLELEQDLIVSGTAVRKKIAGSSVKSSADFRAGVIWATQAGYSNPKPTVDIAILSEDRTKVLLIRKMNEDKYRFPGGFVDNKDKSLEAAARREAQEETNVELGAIHYIGSTEIDDWRYRPERDKIMTTFFKGIYKGNKIRFDNDREENIAEGKWFKIDDLCPEDDMVETHWPLFALLLQDTDN